jgi:glycerophosphoryl diester phosphodiesterase
MNKKNIFHVLLGLFIAVCGHIFFYETEYTGPITPQDTIDVIAHRGFGVHGPDNSLVAATQALEQGLDGIDVDGQLTADGEIVIFHDLNLNRLTSDSGPVANKTLEELKALDLGPKFSDGISGAYISSYEDFLNMVAGRGIYMVELKVSETKDTGIEKKVIEIIQKHNAYDWIILSSFNPLVLWRLEKLDPDINTMMIFMDSNWNKELRTEIDDGVRVNLPWPLRQEPIRRIIRKIVKPDYLSVNFRVDKKTINRLMNKNWPIFLWTPNEEQNIAEALSKGPYGIITDQPLLGKAMRDAQQDK